MKFKVGQLVRYCNSNIALSQRQRYFGKLAMITREITIGRYPIEIMFFFNKERIIVKDFELLPIAKVRNLPR